MNRKSLINSNQPGFFAELWQQAKLVFQLFLDPKVPIYLKLLPLAAVVYLLFPIDILPDVIPGLGQLDDLTILLLGAKAFIELAPKEVVAQYVDRLRNPQGEKDTDAAKSDPGKSSGDSDIIEGIIIEDTNEEIVKGGDED